MSVITQKNCHHEACAQKPYQVLIIDDHPLIRKGVCAVIDMQSDMRCCGEAASVQEAMDLLEKTTPNIVVVDISLPCGCGIDLIHDVKLRYKKLPMLVFSMHDEMLYAERALRAGAGGYVMKNESPERLVEGLRAVLNGELFVSHRVAAKIMGAFVRNSSGLSKRYGMELLSARELQVFEGIGCGMSTIQIGTKYFISPKTVETYRLHIKHKLGLVTGNDLVHAAVRWVEGEAACVSGSGACEKNGSIIDPRGFIRRKKRKSGGASNSPERPC